MTERERFGDFEVRQAKRVIHKEAEIPQDIDPLKLSSQEFRTLMGTERLIVVFTEEADPQEINFKRVVRLADDERLRRIFDDDSVTEIRSRGIPVDRFGIPLRATRPEDDLTEEEVNHLRIQFKLGKVEPGEEADPKIVESGLQKMRSGGRKGFSPNSYIVRAENDESFLIEPKEEKSK